MPNHLYSIVLSLFSIISLLSPSQAQLAPGAPTIGPVTTGQNTANVSFTAPASNGGSAITSYTATSSPGGLTATGSSSPLTITGLTNGTTYTFTVTASNAAGTSLASAASNSVTPGTLASSSPNLPEWQAVVNAGSPTVTNYTTVSGSNPITINVGTFAAGTPRSFEVIFNAIGAGPSRTLLGSQVASSGEQFLKLHEWNNTGKFGLSTSGVANNVFSNSPTLSNQHVHAVFASNGTSTTLYLNGVAQSGIVNESLKITGNYGLGAGLRPDQQSYFDNLDGTISGFASYSRALSQAEVTARFNALINNRPGAPTIGTATFGNALANVTFTAPANDGGSTITSYTATSSPGGLTGTGSASPITVAGLTDGITYTFTVTAANPYGTGPSSSASNPLLFVSNLAPVDLALLGSAVADGNASNSTVGTLSATDPDGGGTHTFTLVSGAGSTDNGSFTISGNTLRITPVTNGSVKNSYTLRVRATDLGGLFFEKSVTVSVVATRATEAKFSVKQLPILPNYNYKQIVTGHLDNDNILDIAATTTTGQCIVITGESDWRYSYRLNAARANTSIALADVTGDGKDNVIVAWGLYGQSQSSAGVSAFLTIEDYPSDLISLPAPNVTLYGFSHLSLADRNHDKIPDIFVKALRESPFSFYPDTTNRPGLTWPRSYSFQDNLFNIPAPNPMAMQAAIDADINFDGLPDVVYATAIGGGSSKISMTYLDTIGGNNYQITRDLFTVAAEVKAVAASDLDGDGRLDLAIAATNGTNGQLILAKGITASTSVPWNRDVVFAAPVTINTGSAGLLAIRCADMNRDGKMDVITSENQQLRVFYGNGDMTLTPSVNNPISLPTTNTGDYEISMNFVVEDFNNDGMPDIFAGNGQLLTNLRGALFPAPTVKLFAGLGQPARPGIPLLNGSSTPQPSFAAVSSSPWLSVAPATGFLGITKPFVSGNPAALGLGIHRGKINLTSGILQGAETNVTLDVTAPSGTLGMNQVSTITANHGFGSLPASGDFNGDGRQDFVIIDGDYPRSWSIGYRVLLTGSNGQLTSVNNLQDALTDLNTQYITPGDYNGDGNLDVASLKKYNGSSIWNLCLATGKGTGALDPVHSIGVTSSPGSIPPMAIKGDFNTDGKDDIAVMTDGEIVIMLGSAGNRFIRHKRTNRLVINGAAVQPPPSGSSTGPYSVGDFNGDGSLDLFLLGNLLLGNGQGDFRLDTSQNHMRHARMRSVDTGDFNGDNITDYVGYNSSDGIVSVNLGSKNLIFSDSAVCTTDRFVYSIAQLKVIDINGDGRLDIVGVGRPNTVITILGNGDGTFQPAQVRSRTIASSQLEFFYGDFTGDGIADIAELNSPIQNTYERNIIPGQAAATTATLATTSAVTATFGQALPVTVTVAASTPGEAMGIPLGSVSLRKGTVIVATSTRTTTGQWTFMPMGLGVGTHTLTAQYDGDTRFTSSTSGSVNITITRASGTLDLSSSPNPSQMGDNVTFTARLSPVTAGNVTFKNGAATLGTSTLNAAGTATFTTSNLVAGSHTITAEFTENSDVMAATSPALFQTVNKLPATVILKNLLTSYDGSAKSAGADTLPAGQPVSFTYNGSSALPSSVGSYQVVATVNSPTYQGTASGTLVIQKGIAAITITNVNRFFDGAQKPVTITTAPAGLLFTVTYNGSGSAPSAIGSYPVVVTINSPNYQGSASDILVISSAAVTTTTLSSSANPSVFLTQPTFTARVSANSGTPSGEMQLLIDNVLFEAKSVNASGIATFTPPASLLRGGTRNIRANYNANAANIAFAPSNATLTQTVNKAPLDLILNSSTLTQTYDGTARIVTASVTPPSTHTSVQVDITYDGGSISPINAGSYTVVATINDLSISGAATGTLTVAKAPVAVTSNTLIFAYNAEQRIPVVQLSPAVPFSRSYDNITNDIPTGAPTASAPINAGKYRVLVSAGSNYELTPSHLPFQITKLGVGITLSNLSVVTDGIRQVPVTAVTNPPGMNLNITYRQYPSSRDYFSTIPTSPDSYDVSATLSSPNHEGRAQARLILRTPQNTHVELTGPSSERYGRSLRYIASIVNAEKFPYPPFPPRPFSEGSPTPTGIVIFKKDNVDIGSAPVNVNGTATLITTFDRRDAPYSITAVYTGSSDFIFSSTSDTVQTTITKAPISLIADSPLELTYDGVPKEVTFTTALGKTKLFPITVTYNGSITKPINASASLIPVVATINDTTFEGSTTVNLRINPALATINIRNTLATFDGTAKWISHTTNPPNLKVNITYNGSSTPPSNVGTYAVVVKLDDPNYSAPNATASLTIGPSTSRITISNTKHLADGNPKAATVSVDPPAPFIVTYDGMDTAPSLVGSYEVNVRLTGSSRQGQASASLVIATPIQLHEPDNNNRRDDFLPPLTYFYRLNDKLALSDKLALYPIYQSLTPGQHILRVSGPEPKMIPGENSWFFSHWTDGSKDHPRTLTVVRGNPPIITAAVMRTKKWIDPKVNPPHAGTITGQGFYDDMALASFRVTPAPGYVVAGWRNGPNTPVPGEFNNVWRKELNTPNSALSPKFPIVDMVKGVDVTLRSSNDAHGRVEGIVSDRMSLEPPPWFSHRLGIPEGKNFTVKAVANTDYVFSHWSFDGASPVGNFTIEGGVVKVDGLQRTFRPFATQVTAVANFIKSEPSLDIGYTTEGSDRVGIGFVSVSTNRVIGVNIRNYGTKAATEVELTDLKVTAVRYKPSGSLGNGSGFTLGGFCPYYYVPLSDSEKANPNPCALNSIAMDSLCPRKAVETVAKIGTIPPDGKASSLFTFFWPAVSLNLEPIGLAGEMTAIQYRVTGWFKSKEKGVHTPYSLWIQ